jgi:predicted membrane protein (TIGR00267 family)
MDNMDKKHKIWLHHLQEEIDAAYLYALLEQKTNNTNERESYGKLKNIEQKHVEAWASLLDQEQVKYHAGKPSVKARIMASLTGTLGITWLREIMLREEGNEVKSYLQLYKRSRDTPTRDIAIRLARDSAGHAQSLNTLMGRENEPWHQTGSGGILHNVVYGFNDGLTANFGLIAGVIGARVSDHFILVSGAAGLIADALSMGASGYLAAKSEQEVYDHEIAMEAEEIRLMPELEEEELSVIYQSKGMDEVTARQMASEVMKDPAKALEEKVHEELGISSVAIKPLKEAWLTGTATAIGAFIPVLPFFIWKGETAIILAFVLAMTAHFGVGATRSLFTGRSLWRSGLEMFIVGIGVAVVGYFIGDLITHWL